MILVQGIGMSGYVPFEGLVGLSHFSSDLISLSRFRLDYGLRKQRCKFYYLPSVKLDRDLLSRAKSHETTDFGILRNVISFAVVRRFKDPVRFTIIRDVGLLSGYYCAGVVFPEKLFYVFDYDMGLKSYLNWTSIPAHPGYIWNNNLFCPSYSSDKYFSNTAWDEYICAEPKKSYVFGPSIFIRSLRYRGERRFCFPVPAREPFSISEFIFDFILELLDIEKLPLRLIGGMVSLKIILFVFLCCIEILKFCFGILQQIVDFCSRFLQ